MDRQNAISLLDRTFTKNFEVERFTEFVTELFNRFNFNLIKLDVWKEYQDYIDSYQFLGSYEDDSGKIIDILVIKLKRTSSRDRARTMQRNFVAKYLGNAQKDAALVAFYGDEPEDWRFSFVKMEYSLVKDEFGKVKPVKELTPAKRYSFLVGVNEPNHTCRSQFLKLVMKEEDNPSLSDIEQAFSIDNVTKEFFDKYKELFLELKESLENFLKNDKNARKEFEEKNISTVDFSKKLLGQIVFIYFLQKKGWLGVQKIPNEEFYEWGSGPKDFLRKLFNKEIVPYNNFFNEILEPLFYEALATPRNDDYYRRFNCKIPFLNGGLFEPINDYGWTETDITLDNSVFDRILSTFDRFNFTVKEDEPLEKEVAVDPEMLGKIFEKLGGITSDNFDEWKKAVESKRKSIEKKFNKKNGIYYTPREIVHYMCQQSLINYLETNTYISRKDIEKYIQMGDVALDQTIKAQEQKKKYHGRTYGIDQSLVIPNGIEKNHKKLDELLKNIKIVDPACGSGAFLIGVLNEIIKARSLLAIFSDKEQNVYDAKRQIIENCLYGVDIEPSAVEISKLRFWLSLVVDELDMRNIKPLPNLDHKIMCGNSLLEEFEGVKLFDERLLGEVKKEVSFEIQQISKEIDKLYKEKGEVARGKNSDKTVKEIDKEIKKFQRKKQKLLSRPKETGQTTLAESMQKKIIESKKKLVELKRLQEQFFNEQRRDVKKSLRKNIDRLEWDLIKVTLEVQGNEEALKKLELYKKNQAKPFFLWKLYFAEVFQRDNPGFDVVIANPPYIQLQKIKEESDKLEKEKYHTFTKTGDIYCLFYEQGIRILNNHGTLTFISSNTWMRAKFGEKLRNFFVKESNPQLIINFEDKQIFSSATVETCITIIRKEALTNGLNAVSLKRDILEFGTIQNYVNQKSVILKDLSSKPWIIEQKEVYNIKEKIEKGGLPIKKWDSIKFYRGILTGYNDAFFIDKKTKKKLIEKDPKNQEIIKPLIRGRNIGRYFYKFENIWIINSHNGLRNKNIERVNVKKDYPYIYDHLKKFKEALIKRTDQGFHWTNLRNCAYLDEFEKEKILWLAITDKPKFALDVGSFVTAPAYFMTSDCNRYLLAILNSKISEWYLDKITSSTGQGTNQWSKIYVEQIPIPYISQKEQNPFIKLVDQILSITKSKDYLDNPEKQAKVKKLEKEVDQLAYNLYGLNKEEIKIIERVDK